FPDDYVTDRSMRFMAAEIVREKLMRFLGDELPYSVTVEIERFKWEEKHYHIAALVLVERDSQKKMVIGNKGERIKTIATEARLDMAAMLKQPVFLQSWVNVKSGWADDDRALRSLGYGEDYPPMSSAFWPAYILHSRPLSDDKLILQLLLPEQGRLSAVVRRKQGKQRLALQPFQ